MNSSSFKAIAQLAIALVLAASIALLINLFSFGGAQPALAAEPLSAETQADNFTQYLKTTNIAAPSVTTIIASQGFGADGGSPTVLGFTETPTTYQVGEDVWAAITSSDKIAGPSSGASFWAIEDIENGNNGCAAQDCAHSLDFADTVVSPATYSCVGVSFDWITAGGWDSGDKISYEVMIDGVSQGSVEVTGGAPTDVWATATAYYELTGAGVVDVVISAENNAGDDEGGIDNVTISGETDSTLCVIPDTMYIAELLADSCDGADDAEHAVVCNFGADPVNLDGWGVGETNTTLSSADTMNIGDTLDEAAGDCDGGVGAAGSCTVAANECVMFISNSAENSSDQWAPESGITDAATCSGVQPNNYRTFEFGQPGPSSGGWFDARFNNNGDMFGLFDAAGAPIACISYGDGNLTFPDTTPAACADVFNGGSALGNLPVPKHQSIDTTVEVNGVGEDWGSYRYTQTAFSDAPYGVCELELNITKSVTPEQADPGDTLTYTITISNPTNIPANALNGGGADLLDTFSEQLTNIQCSTPASGSGGLTSRTLSYTDIEVDAQASVEIVCTAVVDPLLSCGSVDVSNSVSLDYERIDWVFEDNAAPSCSELSAESDSAAAVTVGSNLGCPMSVAVSGITAAPAKVATDWGIIAALSALLVASASLYIFGQGRASER